MLFLLMLVLVFAVAIVVVAAVDTVQTVPRSLVSGFRTTPLFIELLLVGMLILVGP